MAKFDLKPGHHIGGKYIIKDFLGYGWEGEVYHIVEEVTGIGRAAKFFYPERNINNRTLRRYARKLEKLSYCPLVIRYHTHERCEIRGTRVDILVSGIDEGSVLSHFLSQNPGRRLQLFEALVLLRELAAGLEMIHNAGEYHGDLHPDNILIRRKGAGFVVKLIDFYHRGRVTREHFADDICDLVRVFYELLGGQRRYAKLGPDAKYICCGLKRSIITKRFRSASALRQHLDTFEWSE